MQPVELKLPLETGTPELVMGKLMPGVPFAAYRSHPAINASGLKNVLRSPLHYYHEQHNPKPDTDAKRFGRLIHSAVLEPAEYQRLKRIRPAFNLRTKVGKEEAAAWRAGLPDGAIEMSEGEAEQIESIVGACHEHPRLSRLLATGYAEASLLWHDEEHGVDCKGRYDFVSEGTRVIVDLKTTTDARPEPFARDVVKFHYGLSAFHYLEGARVTGVARPDEFVWAVVEKDMPHGVALYRIDFQEIERSRAWWHKAMIDYARCQREGKWPGYSSDFSVLETPAWAPKAIEYQEKKEAK